MDILFYICGYIVGFLITITWILKSENDDTVEVFYLLVVFLGWPVMLPMMCILAFLMFIRKYGVRIGSTK